jgi:RNA recognition motif-containing protein
MAKIYVGNLSYDEDNASLSRLFQDFGEVKNAEVVLYRKSGKSRGFGFVEMNEIEGKFAIEALNGKEINGRALKVNFSDPSETVQEVENEGSTRIYVGNLKLEVDVYYLSKIFSAYGRITSAMIINEQETGNSEGFGFVEMASNEAAIRAIEELEGKEVDGMVLRVNWAKPKPKKVLRSRINY